ncbi:glycosyltransferase family 4 protein [Candidatus Gracilibacteria bacterium]|nr:glycosyltransferase family 4 protein [Candidatus Gracilibacteria bacterium]NUJ98737.1 glycosyltransferase family 4 protein [Candidatus Gracilibacteria bacterium]
MKIAIIHEMFIKLGGAEKVVERLCNIFPQADLYTLIYDEKKVGNIFPKEKIKKIAYTTQKVYELTGNQRFCLPFMAKAIESLDFSNYDIVIASSSGFAHGAITKPETKFIVYYHSPARYLWDWTNEYKKDIGANTGIKAFLFNSFFLKIRQWDYIASQRSDIHLANSRNVQQRIKKYYKKDAFVVYPPIETERFGKMIEKEGFQTRFGIEKNSYFIIVSALTEFKKIDIAIKNFNISEDKLVIVGEGKERKNLENLKGNNNNIVFLGAKYGEDLVELVQNSNGMIFPGEEDFGIVPIETMSAGKPVFAYKGGGLLETIQENISGNFFTKKDGSDFLENFEIFRKNIEDGVFKEELIQKEAEKYSEVVFEENIFQFIEK